MVLASFSPATAAGVRPALRWGLLLGATLLGACSTMVDSGPELDPGPGTTAGAAGASGAAGQSGAAGAAGGQAGAAGGGQAGALAAAYELKGSFDLTFSGIEARLTMGPSDVKSPSSSTALRVDLFDRPAKGEEWQAVVTPRWGQPSTFAVTLVDGALVLSKGNVTLTSTSSEGTVSDVWQTITFEVRGKRLNGAVSAEGQQTVVRGDGAWSGLLNGQGQIARDATAPEGRAGLPGGMGPDDRLLPWDPLQVALAEPLASSEVLGKLSPPAGKGLGSVSWVAPAALPGGLVGSLVGYRQSWQDGGPSLVTALADGYVDREGNKGKGFEKSYELAAVPLVAGPDDLGAALLWGDAIASKSKACEGKACLSFGPFPVGACGGPAAGAALRLPDVPDGKELQLHLRAFTSPELAAAGGYSPEVLSVEVARVGQPPARQQVALPSMLVPCDVVASKDDDLPVCSSWGLVTVKLPPGSGEVGLALRSGTAKSCPAGAPPPTAGASARVLVNGISVVSASDPG